MRNTLEQLYLGNIAPSVKCYKKDSRYGELLRDYCDLSEKLRASLSEEERQMFDKIAYAAGELDSISSKDSFVDGFRLGARLFMESLECDGGSFEMQ